MTASIAAYGRLGGDPVQRLTKAGKVWATASIAVQLDDNGAATWFSVASFDAAAETLLRHGKGDVVSIVGRLQVSRWRGQDGAEREQLQVIAEQVISARTVRPGGARRKSDADLARQAPSSRMRADPPPDDSLPF